MTDNQTIAAISTPLGSGGIGVIRVSGENAIEISDFVFCGNRSLTEAKTHTITYGHIKENDEIIDEVLVSVFHAPHSYTTENVVEIQSHGGIYVMQKILSLLFENGARPAEPGEFTKRAFLGGRIDLSQAEAVMDIISAENERFLQNSERQLTGALRDKITAMRKNILHEVAFIEAALDDPEHYHLNGYPKHLNEHIADWNASLEQLITSSEDGRLLKEGIRTAIIGKPNVGKSSLLNALSKSDRAIVTDIPGTTRDTLEEQVHIGDISLVIIDTAGIRDTEDTVEKIGIERAIDAAKNADLILYVIDASEPLDENDNRIIQQIDLQRTIILLNKSDKKQILSQEDLQNKIVQQNPAERATAFENNNQPIHILSISAKELSGLDELCKYITKTVFSEKMTKNNSLFITNLRHKHLLEEAKQSLKLVERTIADGQPEDFFSIDLMDAYTSLGEIIGEKVTDDLVEEIFSAFCMGK